MEVEGRLEVLRGEKPTVYLPLEKLAEYEAAGEIEIIRQTCCEALAAHTPLSTVDENVAANRSNVAACFGRKNRAFTF